MKSGKLALAVAGVLAGFLGVSVAIGQSVVQKQISGNEVWEAAQGPGGPGQFLGIDTVRNGQSMRIQSGSGAATATALGGTLMWISTAPTTWAVTLPALTEAWGGEQVTLTTDTTLTTLVTVTAGTGTTLHATYNSQTLTALTPVVFQFRQTDKVWYRTQ